MDRGMTTSPSPSSCVLPLPMNDRLRREFEQVVAAVGEHGRARCHVVVAEQEVVGFVNEILPAAGRVGQHPAVFAAVIGRGQLNREPVVARVVLLQQLAVLLIQVDAQVTAPGVHDKVPVVGRSLQGQEVVAAAQALIRHAMHFALEGPVVPGFVERAEHLLPGNAQVGHAATHILAGDEGIKNGGGLKRHPHRDGPLGAVVNIRKYGDLADGFFFLEGEKGL